MLKVKNLSKTYSNGIKALSNVTLDIPIGMYGLLGPNGAGKSTLMRTIATLQEADSGSVHLGEFNVLTQKDKVRQRLGYLPQEFGLYPNVSAEALLSHLAVLKGIMNKKERRATVDQLLNKTNLYEVRKNKLSTYSGGMKRRFGIAQALLANPRLVIVDEPTAGLDPTERNRFHNLLCEIGEEIIVILSTHIVDDVEELCTKMAVINHGHVLIEANPTDAIDQLTGKFYTKKVRQEEIQEYAKQHQIIAERLHHGQRFIQIYSEHDPRNGFESLKTDLSNVYFSLIANNNTL